MSFRRAALDSFNQILNTAGLHILPHYEYRVMRSHYYGPNWDSPPLSDEIKNQLSLANPRLVELRKRYEGHPAAAHTQWNEANILLDLRLDRFRGENHYLYQVRYSPSAHTYYLAAYYVRDTDRLGLFGRLREDGMFGAYTLPFENGYLISRDLLESINELNAIADALNLTAEDELSLLDIGAGYGRLAHRLTEAFPGARIYCTDAVPISTFLSEFYLRFRGAERQATVVPLDEVTSTLDGKKFDLVTNIHSFSECTLAVIDWWLTAIDRMDVRKLMIIPNARDEFRSTELDGHHRDFSHLFSRHEWKLSHKDPIYAKSDVAQKFALYPNFCFYWFERR